MIISTY